MVAQYDVYTKSDCPWCEKAKAYLKDCDLTFEEFDVNSHVSYRALVKFFWESQGKKATVPLVVGPDGSIVGGYEDLVQKVPG